MAGEEANALQPRLLGHIMDRAQQVGQIGAVGDVFAVAVDDLPQQGDLSDALPGQAAHVGDDFANAAAAFDTTPEGDDAEGAGV